MRRSCWLGLALLFAALPVAQAQVQLMLRLPQENVLLYEAVPAVVELRNISGRPLVLDESEGQPWLTFLITDEDGRVVELTGEVKVDSRLTLGAGETATREVDLLRLYDLRAPGTYRVRAAVHAKSARAESTRERLIILAGNEIAREVINVSTPGEATQRTFTLWVKRGGPHYRLYLRVADEGAGLVYAMVPLGTYVPLGEPTLLPDAAGHMHLLARSGAHAIQYRQVDASGQILKMEVYSDLQSNPELTRDDKGHVHLRGGEKVYPRPPYTGPPPEPPAPPPPHKYWWQFWR